MHGESRDVCGEEAASPTEGNHSLSEGMRVSLSGNVLGPRFYTLSNTAKQRTMAEVHYL